MDFKKVTFLKVYTGEDVIVEDMPLFKAVIDYKIGSFFTGLPNMPVTVEIVDTRENIEKILPWLEKNATKALVLVEESTCLITDYMREEEAKKAQEANK